MEHLSIPISCSLCLFLELNWKQLIYRYASSLEFWRQELSLFCTETGALSVDLDLDPEGLPYRSIVCIKEQDYGITTKCSQGVSCPERCLVYSHSLKKDAVDGSYLKTSFIKTTYHVSQVSYFQNILRKLHSGLV